MTRVFYWRLLVSVCVAIIAAMTALAAFALPAQATKGDPYTYTVRVWAGNHGTVNGMDTVATFTGVGYKTQFKLSDHFAVEVTDGRYYVKGFRLSGTDNQKPKDGKTNLRDSFTVTEDTDFVVSYGVRGKMVTYTLHFVESGTNRPLASDVVYEGMPGDKPVVAYEYIQGYRPLYRNITKTLSAEDSENEFTFEYVRLAEGQSEDGTSTSSGGGTSGGTSGGTTGGTTGGATGGTTGGATGGTSPTPAAGASSSSSSSSGSQPAQSSSSTASSSSSSASSSSSSSRAVDANGNPQTEEILDEDVALASRATAADKEKAEQGDGGGGIPLAAIIAIVAVLIAAIGAAAVYLARRRMEEDNLELYDNL